MPANTVGILFDFGSSQASSSVQVGLRAVFGRINVCSEFLSNRNYFEKRCCPRPERLDLRMVLDTRTTVQFFETEVVHLVNEQYYCVCRGFWVIKPKWSPGIILQRLVWIFDF